MCSSPFHGASPFASFRGTFSFAQALLDLLWGALREGPEGLPAVSSGLRHRREVVGRSAIFSGEHFVLEETDWYLLNLFRLWWHYGISFLRLQMWVEEVMEKFMR